MFWFCSLNVNLSLGLLQLSHFSWYNNCPRHPELLHILHMIQSCGKVSKSTEVAHHIVKFFIEQKLHSSKFSAKPAPYKFFGTSAVLFMLGGEDGSDDPCPVQPPLHQAQDPLQHPPRLNIPWPALLRHHVAGVHLHRGVAGPALCLLQQHALWRGLDVGHHLCGKVIWVV